MSGAVFRMPLRSLVIGLVTVLSGCWKMSGLPAAVGDAGGDAGTDAGPAELRYAWHTLYGVLDYSDSYRAIAADAEGDVYVAGGSSGWLGPDGEQPLNVSDDEDTRVFVYKLGADGRYLWHTFYGRDGRASASAIAFGDDGGVLVAGESYETWDGPNGESPLVPFPQPAPGHPSDRPAAFVLRLEPDGEYAWHAFFGSPLSSTEYGDRAAALIALPGGDMVVVGSSMPWDGPHGEPPLHAHSYEDPVYGGNMFALRLGPDGEYRWHTFYPMKSGARAARYGDDLFVVGGSAEWAGPDGEPPVDPLPASGGEGIAVLRLGASGQYRWHTFFGDTPYAEGLLATAEGVFASGTSLVAWDGPAGEPPLLAFSGSGDSGFKGDGYVIAFDSGGNYRWHEFFGPGDTQNGLSSIEPGEGGGLYLTGWSEATWDGPGGEAPLTPHAGGGLGGLVLALGADGAYAWHAFFGSDGVYAPILQSYFGGGALYALGVADGSWSGPDGEAPLHGFTGASDEDANSFVLKLVP
jgi:hypothetical protein